jgi:MFS family permease
LPSGYRSRLRNNQNRSHLRSHDSPQKNSEKRGIRALDLRRWAIYHERFSLAPGDSAVALRHEQSLLDFFSGRFSTMGELHYDAPVTHETSTGAWYRDMTGYCWFVLMVASLAWLFDCLDQQLFNLARPQAMKELLAGTPHNITAFSYFSTAVFLAGWGTGGLVFGAMGDRIGRAKTMMLCILIYSVCTGLSALSASFWDFSAYRFITGLGVGGVFAVGVTLVAETVPTSARAGALGLLQALSTVGNVSAAGIGLLLGRMNVDHAWRWMFVVGALPAAMAVMVQRKVKEPELWLQAKAEGKIAPGMLSSLGEMFRHPTWRKNALLGLVIGCAGIIGFWGIGVFSNDLVSGVLTQAFEKEGTDPAAISGKVTTWTSIHMLMFNVGAFTGMMLYARAARVIGRKPSFAIAFVLAFAATVGVFQGWNSQYQVFYLSPLLGFCQLGIFGLYAIYFPELFPTNLRSTGTSFCYNVGRYVAAIGVIAQGFWALAVASEGTAAKPLAEGVATLRTICSIMAVVYLVGLLALPFAPETKGKPLPE